MSKRGENIYKRRDGRWEARYEKDREPTGRIKYGYCYGRTYKEARSKAAVARIAADDRDMNRMAVQVQEFSFVCAEWLSWKARFVKETTIVKYESIIRNHIVSNLGEHHLPSINEQVIREFFSCLNKKGFSPKTLRDILSVFKSILDYCRKQYGITETFDVILPKYTHKEMRVMSTGEEKLLIDSLLNGLDDCKVGILLAMMTGLRLGEICALKWENISLVDSTVRVAYTMYRIKDLNGETASKTKVTVGTPKSVKSIRIIPLHRDCTVLCGMIGKREASSYVLTGTTEYMEPRTLQNRFAKIVGECGLQDVHFHTLRHTFATRCVEAGFDIKSLSEILGHSSTRLTLDRYVHSSMRLKRANMEKLPEYLSFDKPSI